jgi:hypothetical protein
LDLDEVKRVFDLMEEMNRFFHDPTNYSHVEEFAQKFYPEIRYIYYDILWDWLPEEIQREYEER